MEREPRRERIQRALKSVYKPMAVELARRVRRRRDGLLYVGVTGSCAKTTTKDLVHAVLARRRRGAKTSDSNSNPYAIARAILSLGPRSSFCVAELGTSGPGTLDPMIELLAPRIGVVTHIGQDHYTAFRSLEATAAEKRKLVEALPDDGIAILNADDPLVLAMGERCRGRVLTYGSSETADLRVVKTSSRWPERLSLELEWEGRSLQVKTRLCGAHWAPAVLAALATGIAAGVPLEEGAEAVARCEPWPGRMSPLTFEDGVSFVRDDWKAPYWSVPASLTFLENARAERRILVLGTVSDTPGASSPKYVKLARRALEFADLVLLVGQRSQCALRIRGEYPDGALRGFPRLRDAHAFLRSYLKPGDLVLLEGSHRADHLGRLALAHGRHVACWRERCKRQNQCDRCSLLGVPSEEDVARG